MEYSTIFYLAIQRDTEKFHLTSYGRSIIHHQKSQCATITVVSTLQCHAVPWPTKLPSITTQATLIWRNSWAVVIHGLGMESQVTPSPGVNCSYRYTVRSFSKSFYQTVSNRRNLSSSDESLNTGQTELLGLAGISSPSNSPVYTVARLTRGGAVDIKSLTMSDILRDSSMHARDLISLALTSNQDRVHANSTGKMTKKTRPLAAILPRDKDIVTNIRMLWYWIKIWKAMDAIIYFGEMELASASSPIQNSNVLWAQRIQGGSMSE